MRILETGSTAGLLKSFPISRRGKYDRVGINEKMEVSVYAGTHVCSPKQLSTGTLEQIYFALRISLGEILTDEEPMPFLLDETFARYDETRIRNTLQWIGTRGQADDPVYLS